MLCFFVLSYGSDQCSSGIFLSRPFGSLFIVALSSSFNSVFVLLRVPQVVVFFSSSLFSVALSLSEGESGDPTI